MKATKAPAPLPDALVQSLRRGPLLDAHQRRALHWDLQITERTYIYREPPAPEGEE